MPALLLTADLACSSQVSGAAARNPAWTVEVSMSPARLLEKAAQQHYALVILDLNTPGLDPRTLVPKLQAVAEPPAAILAFGPHVHEEKLRAAAEAGCQAVLARGQFYGQLDQILARYLTE